MDAGNLGVHNGRSAGLEPSPGHGLAGINGCDRVRTDGQGRCGEAGDAVTIQGFDIEDRGTLIERHRALGRAIGSAQAVDGGRVPDRRADLSRGLVGLKRGDGGELGIVDGADTGRVLGYCVGFLREIEREQLEQTQCGTWCHRHADRLGSGVSRGPGERARDRCIITIRSRGREIGRAIAHADRQQRR